MKYCFNCGQQLKDESKFCDACGTPQSAQTAMRKKAPRGDEARYHPHCPKCKSKDVIPVLESQMTEGHSISSISFSGHGHSGSGLGLGMLRALTSNKYGWLCQNCGMQFPNIQGIEKQVADNSLGFELVRVLIILSAICAAFFAILQKYIYAGICLACIVLYALARLYAKKKLEDLKAELKFWKYSCYDHTDLKD